MLQNPGREQGPSTVQTLYHAAPVGEYDGRPDAVGGPAASFIVSLQPDVVPTAAAVPPGMRLR